MNVTDVDIKLSSDGDDRLLGYSTIVIGHNLAIHDIKIIRGRNGRIVSMPSRRVLHRCPTCGHKNHGQARFCNECGNRLNLVDVADPRDAYVDIVHPINQEGRILLNGAILKAFDEEVAKAKAS